MTHRLCREAFPNHSYSDRKHFEPSAVCDFANVLQFGASCLHPAARAPAVQQCSHNIRCTHMMRVDILRHTQRREVIRDQGPCSKSLVAHNAALEGCRCISRLDSGLRQRSRPYMKLCVSARQDQFCVPSVHRGTNASAEAIKLLAAEGNCI